MRDSKTKVALVLLNVVRVGRVMAFFLFTFKYFSYNIINYSYWVLKVPSPYPVCIF